MPIETLNDVKDLFSKITGAHQEDNSYRHEAHVELLKVLKSIIDDTTQRKEMFNWLRTYEEKDKLLISFLKQEIFKIKNDIVENTMTKEDLLFAIDEAVKEKNFGEGTDSYADLMECVENFVDSDLFFEVQEIFDTLTARINDESNDNVELDLQRSEILAEIIFYVISNIYSADFENGHDVIKGSTIFCLPIILRAKQSIIETPDINLLSKTIKKNLIKRQIINNEKNIEIGTSLYNINDMRNLNCENLWKLHNSILFDYETGPDKELRSQVQKHNGETSLIFCFITILSSTKTEKSGIVEGVRILDSIKSSFKDSDLWNDIGTQMENVYTTYQIYQPKDCIDVIANLDSYKDMAKFRVIFSRQEKTFDILYTNLSRTHNLLVMFVDKATVNLNLSYLIEPEGRNSEILLELEKLCSDNDTLLYKHKYPFNDVEFESFNNAINNKETVEVLKYMKNSLLVDNEWKNWLNFDKIYSHKTLH